MQLDGTSEYIGCVCTLDLSPDILPFQFNVFSIRHTVMFDFLSQRFSSIFEAISGNRNLSEKNIAETLEKVKHALIDADVPFGLVEQFIQEIKTDAIGSKVLSSLKPGEQFIKIVYEKLTKLLGDKTIEFSFQLPATVLVMGLQGSGKTTTIAKLGSWAAEQAKKRGKKRNILFASVDFHRPAAIDQLEILAQQIQVSFYRSSHTDPIKAALDIQAYARKNSFELLFLDTAGRLHINNEMMQELVAIDQQLKPTYKLLVLDAMTGQESGAVASAFGQSVGYQYAILSKMDSQTRGGAAFAFRYSQKKQIIFLGIGEKPTDLEQFYPDRIASRILGMGDMLSFIEKAESQIKQTESDRVYKNFMKDAFTLQDFADQLSMLNKLGSLSSVMSYLPGMGNMKLSKEKIEEGEVEIKRFKAILQSMTPKERLFHKILDGSRKKRIASGAGVAVGEVNKLLERFEQSQQYAKLFKKLGRSNGLFR